MALSYPGLRYFADPSHSQGAWGAVGSHVPFSLSLGMGPSPYAQGCFPVNRVFFSNFYYAYAYYALCNDTAVM